MMPLGVRIFPQLCSFEGVDGWVSFQPNIVRLRKTVHKNGLPLTFGEKMQQVLGVIVGNEIVWSWPKGAFNKFNVA